MEISETSTNQQKKGNSFELMLFGWLCYIGAVISIGYGLSKIMMYKNFGSDLSSLNVNAYVGGDGYNYIINGTYATTFCVLAAALAIIGSTCFIVNAINKK
ncbi:hypothetical protein [Haemophilus parahaemolyticus]|uniref:hypothetical protein n=1 Tax=Haemophilus parahaemolyticus TaxID=735 RepID=UPI0028D734CC|nr:hypothetical protein [Haemophilus parahaemolyticus]